MTKRQGSTKQSVVRPTEKARMLRIADTTIELDEQEKERLVRERFENIDEDDLMSGEEFFASLDSDDL
ncbi:hypothetical protein G5C64_15175 [Vibrio diabolicus]|uniref:hypothetical protein n=1 Tax=Vibrio diabolicus TaxID=50719 RepID=UPI002151DED2|nr:hypothetical protein [Vibrio diabolicus]MCE3220171.1 hypothetical protein [Vibrio diabolicus]